MIRKLKIRMILLVLAGLLLASAGLDAVSGTGRRLFPRLSASAAGGDPPA